MNKKWLLGLLTAGSLLGAGLVACGSGSIEAPGDLDEMYVDTFVENINAEVDKAIEACEGDPNCANGLPSESPSSSSEEEAPESSSATETPTDPGSTETPTTPEVTPTSSSSVDVPPGAVTQSSSSVEIPPGAVSPTVSSSSVAVVTPTVSSSSAAVVTPTVSSSSAQTVTPSSSAAVVASSSSAAIVVDPSGATEIVLNYDGALTELSAGKYALTSTNQWSGSLACQASTATTVTVDGVEATIGTSLNNVGNAKPTAQNTVILIVPEGATISCFTRW